VLIKNNDVEGYVGLQSRLEIALQEKGKLEKIQELHQQLSDALEECESNIEELGDDDSDPNENVAKFNEFFTDYSEKTIKEVFLLYLTEGAFPLGITAKSGLSTGTKKSVIMAFDLAYQSHRQSESIDGPSFFVHDVIEIMDATALENAVKISNTIGCQYIVAVLNDKIKDVDAITDEDIRLKLSEDNKLFLV